MRVRVKMKPVEKQKQESVRNSHRIETSRLMSIAFAGSLSISARPELWPQPLESFCSKIFHNRTVSSLAADATV